MFFGELIARITIEKIGGSMIFPYSFIDLVTQSGRYQALNSGYHDAIEKVLARLLLSEDRVSEIRARAGVQSDSFALIHDIFGGLIETHQPKEVNFPKIAYLFKGNEGNEFCFYIPFLKNWQKPNGFPENYGIVGANNTKSHPCQICSSFVPIVYKVSESEKPTKYAVCLRCEIVRTIE